MTFLYLALALGVVLLGYGVFVFFGGHAPADINEVITGRVSGYSTGGHLHTRARARLARQLDAGMLRFHHTTDSRARHWTPFKRSIRFAS